MLSMKESGEKAREHIQQMALEQEDRQQRVKEATDQILRISSQLQLTWYDLECVVERVKKFGKIR